MTSRRPRSCLRPSPARLGRGDEGAHGTGGRRRPAPAAERRSAEARRARGGGGGGWRAAEWGGGSTGARSSVTVTLGRPHSAGPARLAGEFAGDKRPPRVVAAPQHLSPHPDGAGAYYVVGPITEETMLEVGVATTDAPPAAAGFSGFMKPAAAPSRASSSRPASATRSVPPRARPQRAVRGRSRVRWRRARGQSGTMGAGRIACALRRRRRPLGVAAAVGLVGARRRRAAVPRRSPVALGVSTRQGCRRHAGRRLDAGRRRSGGSSRPSSAARSNASARSGGPPPRQPWAPGRYGKSDTFDEVAHARKATQAVAHARALVDLEAQVAALEKGDISADELARHLSKASAHLPAGLANRLRDMVLTTAGRSR